MLPRVTGVSPRPRPLRRGTGTALSAGMAPPRRARSPWRWFRRALAVVVAIPLIAAALAAAAIYATLPGTEAALRIAALSRPVEVVFDGRGVPTIRAANERDAAAAMGVLHARDRLFQMEMLRRGASGRLSEIAGASTLRLDRTVLTLGLRRRAEADLAFLPADTRALLDAYAAGVNAWVNARGRFAAPEFLVLGRPEPWTPVDSLLFGKVMGLWLSGSYRTDLERARLARTLSPERLADLWPADDTPGRADLAALPPTRHGSALAAADLPPARHLDTLLAALPAWGSGAPFPPSASNAWAIAGARSVSGAPLLAADPHLGFTAPILWYLARVELPDGRYVAGATAPGVPLVVIGRNDRLAWGFTTTHSDTQDAFVERLSGRDAYETPDGPRPFTVREERIPVRGRPDEVLRVRETRHGPVISDLDDAPPGDTVIAVAMANLAPEDTAALGLHRLNRARDVTEARAAAALITSPPQNLMLADAEGGIAMILTGRTPVRASGDGALPVAGHDGAADWTGWVPFDALPHVVSPGSGAVVNANNRVQPAGAEVFLGRDWFGDWRFRRIGDLLRQRSLHDARDMAAMQVDALSLFARETLPFLLSLRRPSWPAGDARDLLLGWDGSMTPDAPQPLVFNAWWREFGALALEAGGVPRGSWNPGAEFVRHVLTPAGAPWCGEAGCAALATRALETSVGTLMTRYGGRPSEWRWGDAHRARFEHPLLRLAPLIGPALRIEAATPGDGETVNRGGAARDLSHVHGPGLRMVADLGRAADHPDAIRAVIATGQSGNPFSRRWRDWNADWAAGRLPSLLEGGRVHARIRLDP